MKILTVAFKYFCGIHAANYAGDPKADELFNAVGNEVGAASWADVSSAPTFGDYCDRTDQIDFLQYHGIRRVY